MKRVLLIALVLVACEKSTPSEPPVVPPADLSASGTANCYIVSAPGKYSFNAVKGNKTESVGEVHAVEVLWESFGTDTAPSVGDIVSEAAYDKEAGTIVFSTPSSLKNGNAVIAAKDSGGNILWSWHIWVCEGYDPVASAQEYAHDAGTLMDRNLGATCATPGDVGALGLLYQWGRKDPFLGSSSISAALPAASTRSWPPAETRTSTVGTIEYTLAHPTTFIKGDVLDGDWLYANTTLAAKERWKTAKTVYDPCPPGWRTPDGGSRQLSPKGVWATAAAYDGTGYPPHDMDNVRKGHNFSGLFGLVSPIWYPCAGIMSFSDASLFKVGTAGGWWSCYGTYSFTIDGFSIAPVSHNYREGYAMSVRCMKE